MTCPHCGGYLRPDTTALGCRDCERRRAKTKIQFIISQPRPPRGKPPDPPPRYDDVFFEGTAMLDGEDAPEP